MDYSLFSCTGHCDIGGLTDEFRSAQDTMLHRNDDNGDALRRLEAEGDDLSLPRDIDFNVVFSDEIRAKEFAEQFQREGHRTTVQLANVVKTHPWEVVVVKNMIPTHSGITDFEQELQNIADALGGYNDGWGCFLNPVDTCSRDVAHFPWIRLLVSRPTAEARGEQHRIPQC